jgi:hypothetical protein
LFIFASAGTAKVPDQNPNIGKLMIVSACMFILGFAMTWAPYVAFILALARLIGFYDYAEVSGF